MKGRIPFLVLLLLLAACFSLATVIQPRAQGWSKRAGSGSVLKVLLGDSRRLFANHFFVQADVSFHSGYYPSIFDQAQAPGNSRHMTAKEGDAAPADAAPVARVASGETIDVQAKEKTGSTH